MVFFFHGEQRDFSNERTLGTFLTSVDTRVGILLIASSDDGIVVPCSLS